MLVIACAREKDLDFHIDTEDLVPWGRKDGESGYLGVRMADVLPVFVSIDSPECSSGKHKATFPVQLPCCKDYACFECATQNLLGNDFVCFCGSHVPIHTLIFQPLFQGSTRGVFDYRVSCPFGCGCYFLWDTKRGKAHLRDCVKKRIPDSSDPHGRLAFLKKLVSENAPRQPIYIQAPPTRTAIVNIEKEGILGAFDVVQDPMESGSLGSYFYYPVVQDMEDTSGASSVVTAVEQGGDDVGTLTFDLDQATPVTTTHAVPSAPIDKNPPALAAGSGKKKKTAKGTAKTVASAKASGLKREGKGKVKGGVSKDRGMKKSMKVKQGVSTNAGTDKEAELARQARIVHRRTLSAAARQRKAQIEKDKGPLIPDLVIGPQTRYLVGSQVNRVLGLNRGILYIKHPRLWHRKASLNEKRYLARIKVIDTSCVKANLVRAAEVEVVAKEHHPEHLEALRQLHSFELETTPELMFAPSD